MLGIGIAFLAACCWGMADFGGGFFSRRHAVPSVLFVIEAGGLAVLAVVMVIVRPPLPDTEQALSGLAAGATGTIALGVFYRALALGSMSIVAPISSTGAVIPVIVGIATGDTITVLIGLGLATAFVGILLASREAEEELGERPRTPAERDERRAILLALCAAVGLGLFFVFYDTAADGGVLWATTMQRAAAVPIIGAALLAIRGRPAPGRDGLILFALGVLDCAAIALYAVAANEGDLAVVAVVGSLYPVVTVLMARLVLRERMHPVQAVGVVCALAGVAMVSLGSA